MVKKLSLLFTGFFILFAAGAQNADSAARYFAIGQQELAKKNYIKASSAFSKAVFFEPAHLAANLKNAETYSLMRKQYQAIQAYEQVLGLDAANEQAITALVKLYYDYRQDDKFLALASKCGACSDKEKMKAEVYVRKQDYPMAEKCLLAYLATHPSDGEANYLLADTYTEMELEQKAMPYLAKAVSWGGAKAAWFYDYGILLYNGGKYSEAANAYATALEKGYPSSLAFLEQLGQAYIMGGQFDKGEKAILEIVAKRPGDKELMRSVASLLYKKGEYDRSLGYCQRLLEIDKTDGRALYQAGLNFIKKGQRDKGEAMCDQAIEMDPSLKNLRKEVKGEF